MPVSGRPRNPLGQTPSRFRERRVAFVTRPGETPGTQDVDLRADVAAAGTIRRLYRQSVNFVPAPPPVSWLAVGDLTRALRYKASTTYRAAGTDNTREGRARPLVPARHNARPVTLAAGNQQGRPTVRNRMTSFGRRVPVLNSASKAAQR